MHGTQRFLSSVVRPLIILSTFGTALAQPVAQGQVTFFMPPTYAGNQAIFVADFNSDGIPDILTADGTLNLGNGDGTFRAGTPVALPGQLVAVGDFNGDGKPDVLEQGLGTLLVLLGNGDGTFQPSISTGSGASLSPVIVGDVNGDGKADVLGIYNNDLVVYLSNGDGTFTAGVSYPVANASSGPSFITLGDFNGDQKVDVVVSVSGDNVAGQEIFLVGNGNGTFQAGLASAGVYYPGSVVAGDFNGDGKLDLAISTGPSCNTACGTFILLGDGSGSFTSITFSSDAGSLAAGDVNGDGKLDLVLLTSNSGVIEIYLGNGGGTFSSTHSYQSTAPGNNNPIYYIALADFNLDGKLDVAAAGSVLLGNGDGTFQGWPAVMLPSGVTATVVGDFDKNGTTDVAALSTNNFNNLYILTNDGTGTLSLTHTYTLQQPGYAIATADVNGDGNLDLVVEGTDGITQDWSYSVLLGNGDGSFQPPAFYQQTTSSQSGSAVVIADFNGDGKPDLAFVANGSLAVLLGNGDGTFGAPAYFFDGGAGRIVSADFNSDGQLDIAAAGISGLAILLGNGDGTFQAATFPFTTDLSHAPLLAADLTGDNTADLVSGNQVWLGNGSGGFTALAPADLDISLVADINGDGKADAINGSTTRGGSVGYALGNGDGTFGPYATIFQGDAAQFVQATDMNRDGKNDLLVASPDSLFVLINTTGPVAAASFSPSSLTFLGQTVGSSSGAAPVMLTNTGAVALTVTGVTLAGANAGEFGQTNNCTTVQPSASCTINVTFTPTLAGVATANLAITDNAGTGRQIVVVSGTGTTGPVPGTSFSPASVTFPLQTVGSSSGAAPVMLTNTGTAALTVAGVTLAGVNAVEFGQTNNCTTVQPSATCTINVTFTPTSAGAATANLTVADNAGTGSQVVVVSGTGTTTPDFTFGVASGAPSSETITAGQTATFSLVVTPAGSFSGTVNVACGITPAMTPAPMCSLPASVSVTGSTAVPVAVAVATMASGSGAGGVAPTPRTGIGIIAWMLALGASVLFFAGNRRRPALAASMIVLSMIVLSLIAMAGCGGGSSQITTSTKGTPAGTYTVTVTATSGSLSHQAMLTVIVQ